ncbi:S-adenosylmethionine:tRNA ribosyltransferase-isomerase [Arcicella sp. LKC2W]|uniref:S-adenosylmethionine:tRNA ribosyltransferase-isomerase n=1 Tax=Arcicella sp. LKC2W TaxID=2984198 RepID=UPI002B1F5AD5|nr:S-adenosylmethionine:tRNA ribosyltransferase-isomerase [Arcicella sp. LKC2W]MEA5461035.1 S-adenosylmethionine:tRNA ribosyltransferase-isomerase [Arcicella sp. LKC2W]
MQNIKLSDYTYDLPDERIAKFPLPKRDESKLQVYQHGKITHTTFKNITDYLPQNSLLVFNNTKVIPARIHFQKSTGAVIQIFLLHPVLPTPVINLAMEVTASCVWECMIGNRKRWKKSDILTQILTIDGQQVEVNAEIFDEEKNHVQLSWATNLTPRPSPLERGDLFRIESSPLQRRGAGGEVKFVDLIQSLGQIPLPPYLNREAETADYETYQTVYSEKKGAVAAPTAGLHFTEEVLKGLENQGIKQEFLTLHVGAGTFQPIKVENIIEHKMHNEQVVISKQNIENLLNNLGNIIPVGTTSMRTLESVYWYGVKLISDKNSSFFIEKLYPYQHENVPTAEESLKAILQKMVDNNETEITGETEIFIFPSYQFKLCKGIITNYHQPESTLILLIAALIGEDWRRVYEEAMTKDYRFLSYGDSSLLLP